MKTLDSVIANYSRVYIVVDALDECADSDGTRRELLTNLGGLQNETNTNLMATSRFEPHVMKMFKGVLSLRIRASDDDIKQFVRGQIHRLPNCVQRDPDLQRKIQDDIVEATDGM